MLDAVRAPGKDGEDSSLTVYDFEALAIAQSLPSVGLRQMSPAREVEVFALVMAAFEMGHAARGDEKGGLPSCYDLTILEAVLARRPVQIAQVAPDHG